MPATLQPRVNSSEQPTKPGNVEFYDSAWQQDWMDMERLNPTARHLRNMIVREVRRLLPLRNLVEFGCGMGVNLKVIHENFPELALTGADVSPKSLKMAEGYLGKSPRVSYHAFDLAKGQVNETFDFVLCSQVLEHIEDDVAALASIASMCSKYLMITVPSGSYNSTSKLVGHIRHYSKAELLDKVEGAGFQIVWVREWGFPFHSIYKRALGSLPENSQRKMGLGKYGVFKRILAGLLFCLFYGNVFDAGENIVLLATKK